MASFSMGSERYLFHKDDFDEERESRGYQGSLIGKRSEFSEDDRKINFEEEMWGDRKKLKFDREGVSPGNGVE